jgi:hypothetical protein
MAESIVQVTEGSGKKLHTFQRTIGANLVEDEVIVAGVPYLATYKITTVSTSTANANTHLLQIMAGASLNVYVTKIQLYQAAVATAAILTSVDIFRLTSAGTGGTIITPQALDGSDAASGATSMTLPSAQGAEAATRLDRRVLYLLQTVPTAVDFNPLRAEWTYGDFDTTKFLRIAAGTANGIAVKNITAVAAATVILIATFFEANF